jgi:hypothetical protein
MSVTVATPAEAKQAEARLVTEVGAATIAAPAARLSRS